MFAFLAPAIALIYDFWKVGFLFHLLTLDEHLYTETNVHLWKPAIDWYSYDSLLCDESRRCEKRLSEDWI